jgi:hypothetical protein
VRESPGAKGMTSTPFRELVTGHKLEVDARYRGERDNRRKRDGLVAVLASHSTGSQRRNWLVGGEVRPKRPTVGKVMSGLPFIDVTHRRDIEPMKRCH